MIRKTVLSMLMAISLMLLLVGAVGAQADVPAEEVEPATIEPTGGAIVQSVPMTLTVSIPGPDGAFTVEVPIVITLDVQVAISNQLTATVAVTSEVEAVDPDAEISAIVTDTEEAVADEAAEDAVEEAVTEEPEEEEPVAEEPAEAEPVDEEPTEEPEEEVAPTPVPVGQDDDEEAAEDEAAAEEDSAVETEDGTEEAVEEDAEAVTDEEDAAAEEAAAEEAAAEEAALNCSDMRSVIFTPEPGDVISGTLEVYGTATHDLFRYYKLEYQSLDTENEEFAFIVDNEQRVQDGLLAVLDTTTLADGEYNLRLTVVDNTGNFPPQCTITVTIAN